MKVVLDKIGVPSYCKTSGSTALHICIPLAAKYTYDQSQMFARMLATIVHKQKRGGKMYLDFLQNRPQATIAGPYSLRPNSGATVSMPLHWDKVKPDLTMRDFNIFNTMERLAVMNRISYSGNAQYIYNMEICITIVPLTDQSLNFDLSS